MGGSGNIILGPESGHARRRQGTKVPAGKTGPRFAHTSPQGERDETARKCIVNRSSHGVYRAVPPIPLDLRLFKHVEGR